MERLTEKDLWRKYNDNKPLCKFFLIIYSCVFLVPAVILGILGEKTERFGVLIRGTVIKWYGIIASIPMMVLLFGLTSIQMFQFVTFILCETLLIYAYYFFKKRAKSELVYFAVFALSILPIFNSKNLCSYK